jgi:hypothetical protein
MDQPVKSGSGCLKATGIGCGVVLLLAVIAGGVLVTTRDRWMPVLAAKSMVMVAGAMLDQLKIPADEKEAALVPIRELAQKVRAREVSMEQAEKMFKVIADGPLPTYLTLRAFELSYVAPSALSVDEKKEASLTISRFMRGLVSGRIEKAKGEEIRGIVVEKKQGPDGKDVTELKATITGEELKKCLAIMKSAADEAGIEAGEYRIDLATEIRRSIEQGLAAPPATPSPEAETK